MKQENTHIIHRANLLVEVPDEEMGRQWYRDAPGLFKEGVLPELARVLAQYDTEGSVRLDALDINIHLSPGEMQSAPALQSAIVGEVARQLETIVKSKREAANGAGDGRDFSDADQKAIAGFVFFLRTGRLPWYFTDGEPLDRTAKIVAAIQRRTAFFTAQFDGLLKADKTLVRKILAQYDSALAEYIMGLYVPASVFSAFVDSKKALHSYFSDYVGPDGVSMIISEWTAQVGPLLMAGNGNVVALLRKNTEAIIVPFKTQPPRDAREVVDVVSAVAEPGVMPPTNAADAEPTRDAVDEETARYFPNAGLVLLHPFLQYFFAEFSLLNTAHTFKDEHARGTAVHLLHYLATYTHQAPDFELTFAKYLCGMPLAQFTPRQTVITDAMKTESERLLNTVINHWAALKQTSPRGLQEAFLQRKAKLIAGSGGDRLVFEPQATDILLDRLPWGISIVKLPWLTNLIYAEWNS